MVKSLKRIKKPIKQWIIKSFDIETYGRKNKFLFCGYIDKDRTVFFTNSKKAINYMVEHQDKESIVFATNLGFDFAGLFFPNPEPLSYSDMILRNGDLIMARYEDVRFADSNNFCNPRLSVEKMGEILQLSKIRHPSCLGKKPKNKYEWKKIKRYNARDCLITKLFMERLQESFNTLGCQMQLTIASTAMDLYRRKYMPIKTIWHEHSYKKIKKLIFKSYYGGRVECFKRGKLTKEYLTHRPLQYYDFNSLYPSVMRNAYPLPNSCFIVDKPQEHNIYAYMGITTAEVIAPPMRYPILPYRDEENKLIFPIGTFKGTWTHHELSYALKNGYTIKKLYKQIIYRKCFYPFKAYVDELYYLRKKYREENNEFMQLSCKLLMNSLYGKFATKEMAEYDLIDGEIIHTMSVKEFDERTKGYDMKAKKEDAETYKDFYFVKDEVKHVDKNYIIPIFSTYVTSYGRVKLHQALVKHQALYCDTDSIITYDDIPDSKELGELKKEMTIKTGWIVKPKLYYVESNDKQYLKMKGVKKAQPSDFLKMLQHKKILQEKFIKMKESIVRKLSVNERIQFEKFISLEDTKRVWSEVFNEYELQDSEPINIS